MRMIMIGVMVAGLAGAGAYVFKLRADNATLKANAIKLESAISDQKQLIENQQKDFKEILNTRVSYSASKLSGGQLRRLALIKAVCSSFFSEFFSILIKIFSGEPNSCISKLPTETSINF